ncbi:hypothetical protein ACFLW2_04140 [Chloroflexota bacterium]
MADGLLSQSDIDALIQGQRGKEIAVSKAKAVSAVDSSPPTPSQPPVKTITVPQAGDKPPQASIPSQQRQESIELKKPDSSLEARLLNLEQRLNQVEKVAGNLEQLEKKLTGGPNTGQVSAQQLQVVVQHIQELTQQVTNISNKLKGTLGYGAYQTFKCDKCTSQGHVATVLKCTKCGQESWRGWWPKKQSTP